MKKGLLILFGFALAFLVLAYGVGSILPREHKVTIRATFDQNLPAMWDIVTSFEKVPDWNPRLKSAKRLPDQNGHEVWQEEYEGGTFYFETTENVFQQKLTRKILNDDIPYGGTWTFEFEPQGDKTQLSITEDGYVDSPLFRFIAKFFIGHASNISSYMFAFGKKTGEKLKIEVIWPNA